jgi:hypothetical protein
MTHRTSEDLAVGVSACVLGGAAIAVAPTNDTGPILAFVAAVLVTVLTARMAAQRQRAALDAEAERQLAQLRHDRKMQDVADLRRVLENAFAAAETLWELARLVFEADQAGEHLDVAVGQRIDDANPAMARAIDALQIRLGDNDPILLAFQELAWVTDQAIGAEEATDDLETMQEQRTTYYRAAVEASKRRVGSELPSSS